MVKRSGHIALSVAMPTADPEGACLILTWSHTLVEIGHEIISAVIFLLLIQEGLLSITSEIICTKYWLTPWSSLPRKKSGLVN